MPTVKIKELPQKSLKQVMSTDIMVIEDSIDTYQIPVSDLLLLFSSDSKINALTEACDAKLAEMQKRIEELGNTSNKDYDKVMALYQNLYNDHEETKMRLGKLREEFTDAQNDIQSIHEDIDDINAAIVDINKKIESLDTRITALEKDNTSNKSRLDALEKDNTSNKDRISKLETSLSKLTTEFNNFVNETTQKFKDVSTEFKEYTDKAYDNLMEYIDYYHHVHTNPPNFDEPYKGDPITSAYIHPVGSIFETTDPEFDINEWFPGTWKFIGVGAAYDKDNVRTDYFTYIRVQ